MAATRTLAAAALIAAPAAAQGQPRASGGQRMQEATANDVLRCARKLGTVSIEDGRSPVWAATGLSAPSRLLKVIVQRFNCFDLVDRGGGLIAASRERAIASNLGMQRRGGFFAIGGAIGGGYDNTDIGRVMTLSFIQACSRLVEGLHGLAPGAAGAAEASPTRAYTAQGAVAMRTGAVAGALVVRTLSLGDIVYPTGKKSGLWWEVADENDDVDGVLDTRLAPSN